MSTTQSIVFVIVINNENIFKFVEGCFKTVREIDETVFGVNDRPRTGAGGGRICYSISLQGRFTSEAIRRKIVHSMSRRTRYAPKRPRYTIKGMEGGRRKEEGRRRRRRLVLFEGVGCREGVARGCRENNLPRKCEVTKWKTLPARRIKKPGFNSWTSLGPGSLNCCQVPRYILRPRLSTIAAVARCLSSGLRGFGASGEK